MSLNFFDNSCQEIPINKKLFGIRDDIDGIKAYIDENNPDDWAATVKNEKGNNGEGYNILFTAIDKCVLNDVEYPNRGRCEGMLTTEKHLFLLELKDRAKLHSGDMLIQLESTINFLNEFHPNELSNYKHKKVFGCNKKKKGIFYEIDNELQKKFFDKYKFRIDIQTDIVLV
ncbi:hypothetical protein NZ698_05690 [Chryseobacterium sp. PBS4-4]|uniref:Uncharacterized protein n=1 Tax=Chryseobacterium edaphi TaxID=2976532 RepID=A0ABT2W5Y9_9FLAO|nr:hypothetical protein [Chryseobacterium edaphi]MCU7616682.1 hypothetical protein [Chryseobacterium edaphi]